jgi:hypothetical protein
MELLKILPAGLVFFFVLSLVPADAQPCNESWVCMDWSFCLGSGVQMRSCTDLNRCVTEKDKPAEIQRCDPPIEREINLPQQEQPGVTGLLISNTPAVLAMIALALGVAAYILYRKWKDLRMFISPP